MRTIKIDVGNEYLQGAGVVIGAEGSANDVVMQMKFSDSWTGLSKYATFTDAKGEGSAVVTLGVDLLETGETNVYNVPVPARAKLYEGKSMLTITGYTVVNGSESSTVTNTTTGYFRVLPATYSVADDGSIDTTLAQQLQAQIDDVLDDISAVQSEIGISEAWAVGTKNGVPVESTDDQYENNSKYWAEQSSLSASDASDAKDEAEASATAALASETNAKASETSASASVITAATSEANAATSASNAATSEANASASETNASTSASNASASAIAAEKSKNDAATISANVSSYTTAAQNAATASATSESNAKASEIASKNSENIALGSASEAKSYAVGGTGTRSGEDTDNAKYWATQAQQAAGGSWLTTTGDASNTTASFTASGTLAPISTSSKLSTLFGGIATAITELISHIGNKNNPHNVTASQIGLGAIYQPQGSVTFANLPAIASTPEGYVYDITDSFTTTADFKCGAGVEFPAGTNVVALSTKQWDCLSGAGVNGVKGNLETNYRAGAVNIQLTDIIAVDSAPVQNSTNMVTSGAVYDAVANAQTGFTGTTAEVNAAIAAGQLTDGTHVTITDDFNSATSNAISVSYDDTLTQFGTTNVQGAIGAVNTSLESFKSDTDDAIDSLTDSLVTLDNDKADKFIYSTDEVDTGKKWIDGKTIYKKVLKYVGSVGTMSTTPKTISHGIENLGLLLPSFAFTYDSSSSNPYYSVGMFCVAGNSTNVIVEALASYTGTSSNHELYVVMEYTKAS